jgi:hypothetical protein
LKLSKDVFKLDKVIAGVIPYGDDTCRFDYKDLENAIKGLIKSRLGSEDVTFATRPETPSCPTFVVAKLQRNMGGPPVLFRSYRIPGNSASNCAIWQAARATSAAPTFFKAMEIQDPDDDNPGEGPQITYVDGGLGHNNPAQLARQEARELYPESSSCVLISLGTGLQRSVEYIDAETLSNDVEVQRRMLQRIKSQASKLLKDVAPKAANFGPGIIAILQMANAMSRLVTNSENVHYDLDTVESGFTYFRFNVERDVGDIGLEDYAKMKEILDLSVSYFLKRENNRKKIECVRDLNIRK